jgi:hypothetical protein
LFYYLHRWNLARAKTREDGEVLGGGGFFVSLRTGEIQDPGSLAGLEAQGYLRLRDGLSETEEPSMQELALLLAEYSWEQLVAMRRALLAGR